MLTNKIKISIATIGTALFSGIMFGLNTGVSILITLLSSVLFIEFILKRKTKREINFFMTFLMVVSCLPVLYRLNL